MDGQLINCGLCKLCGEIIDFDDWDVRLCNYHNKEIRISNHCVCQHFTLKQSEKPKYTQVSKSKPIPPTPVVYSDWLGKRYMLIRDMVCSMPDPSSVTENELIRIFNTANKIIAELMKYEDAQQH